MSKRLENTTTEGLKPLVPAAKVDSKESDRRAVDAVRQWLNSTQHPRNTEVEPLHPSYRKAAEEAVRCYEEIVKELNPREAQNAYIHLLVGRGFARTVPAPKKR